jgi:hypothetical protein
VEKELKLRSLENEEILKDKIFSVFFNSLNDPSRQQVYFGQLSGLIYNWCRDYLDFDVNDMGVEIVVITKRLLKDKTQANIPQDKIGFIKYLLTSLKRGKYEYIRNYEKRNQDDLIRMKESHLGRKLTEDEQVLFINKWYDYENAIKLTGTSLTGTKSEETPLTDYLNSSNTTIIHEAIQAVLGKKQKRARDCYKALLTLRFIDFVDLYPVLDSQIIEDYRQKTEKPKQYEIYQKFHPEATKVSSEAMACKNLKELLCDIKTYLKDKYPEIFH